MDKHSILQARVQRASERQIKSLGHIERDNHQQRKKQYNYFFLKVSMKLKFTQCSDCAQFFFFQVFILQIFHYITIDVLPAPDLLKGSLKHEID